MAGHKQARRADVAKQLISDAVRNGGGECVPLHEHRQIARLFTIEVKRDAEAERGSRSESRRITVEDQARWGRAVRRIGGFYCIVHDLADAKAAVDRCRTGESQ